MKNIAKTKICIKAKCGARISNCIREAVIMSMQERVNVELTHNSKKYIVCYDAILNADNLKLWRILYEI
jgi:hypothetical protein